MYKLNKKVLAGMLVIGGLGLSSLYPKKQMEPISKKILEETKGKKIEFDQEIDGCIVYCLKTRTWDYTTQTWSDWQQEFNKYYLGTPDEIYDMVVLDIYGNQYYKKTVGMIDNDYTTNDFKVVLKTYHEEQCEIVEEQGKERIKWIPVGKSITLENNDKLPQGCMSKWILDEVEYEEREPDSQMVKIEDGTEMNGLVQAYNVIYKNGEIILKPTPIFSTITNIPNENYYWKLVGYYEKSEELEQDLSKDKSKKPYTI